MLTELTELTAHCAVLQMDFEGEEVEVDVAEDEEEFEMDHIVGAKVVRPRTGGAVVYHCVKWMGGEQRWGKRARTWEPALPDSAVRTLWDSVGGIVGRKLRMKFGHRMVVGEIEGFCAKDNKHKVFFGDYDPDNGYYDLINAQRHWEFESCIG